MNLAVFFGAISTASDVENHRLACCGYPAVHRGSETWLIPCVPVTWRTRGEERTADTMNNIQTYCSCNALALCRRLIPSEPCLRYGKNAQHLPRGIRF